MNLQDIEGARLYIDDERKTPIGFTHRAKTYEEAIKLLSDPSINWGFVSFDHDLAPEHYAGDFSRTKTGYDIATWVEERAHAGEPVPNPFKWAVHSMNPEGRRRIERALEAADRFWGDPWDLNRGKP